MGLHGAPRELSLVRPALPETEEPLSAVARNALTRVALAMGAREGTAPEDDPFTRALSVSARTKERAANVIAVLQARNVEVSRDFTEDQDIFSELSGEALMAAALACADEDDFRRRVRTKAGFDAPLQPPDPLNPRPRRAAVRSRSALSRMKPSASF